MSVENYREAQKAIHNIIANAKIPASAMVSILEIEKLSLVDIVFRVDEEKQSAQFFDKLRDEKEKENNAGGMS